MANTALNVANAFITRYPQHLFTNLSLNKLVYFAQVESLKKTGKVLFDSEIQAWSYGPVEPEVYHAFSRYGSMPILVQSSLKKTDDYTNEIVDSVIKQYGFLSAFDLVTYSHRQNSAWSNVYDGTRNKTITAQDILKSDDITSLPKKEGTLAQGMEDVYDKYRNTFKLLGDA